MDQMIYNFRFAFLILILLSSRSVLIAQVSGVITDNKTSKPLTGVEVFINKTTIGALSDETGRFQLEGVPNGFADIVLYKNGYSLYRSSMKIQSGRAYDVKLTLIKEKPKKSKQLTAQELTVLKSKLGGSNSATSYSLANENEITASDENGQRIFSITTPINIQTESLGYQIKYFATGLALSDIAQAPIRYEYLPATDMQTSIEWEKNRKNIFEGSLRHWLMVLVADQLKAEGYSMQDEQGNAVDEKSIVTTSSLEGYYKISSAKPFVILYKRDEVMETSRVTATETVTVNASGVMINPKVLIMEGDMAKMELANQVPLDYQLIAGDVEEAYAETMRRFYEKTYVHTDKPYYYPGERIWFKAYMNYYYQPWRDSLSKTVYVELINPEKEIVMEKTLRIDSGFAHNDFILPDSLEAGTYYLRAYTNLQRNFGDDKLFVKPIPILNLTDKVVYNNEEEKQLSDLLIITTDKPEYKTREKITVTLKLKDKNGNPMAGNFSISVTDAAQVLKVPEWGNIKEKLAIRKEEISKITNLNYPLEYGVGFAGQFLNDNGKPERALLNFMQMKPRNVMLAETDEKGFFKQTGLNFYDTTTFYYKADKAKDLPYGKVKLVKRDVPTVYVDNSTYKIEVTNAGSVQRIISEYEKPKDAIMLKEVEVKGRRIEDITERAKMPFGKPDVVLKANDLGIDKMGYPNLLYYLVGKVAGVNVRPAIPSIEFTRASGQSINFQSGPLVVIDNVPLGGDAAQTLSMINPNDVESIGFSRRINVLYGSQGAAGVISVNLKKGEFGNSVILPNFSQLKLFGYSPSNKWLSPDYPDSKVDTRVGDYRSTVYWNREVVTNTLTGTVTMLFFAADLPSKYRIIVEGVTQSGEQVRCSFLMDVGRD